MPSQEQIDLSLYRMEKARDCLKASEMLFRQRLLMDSANRSYYAIFHSMRALLALEGADFKKHSGVIAYFQGHYVKTGIFDKSYSDTVKKAFSIRQDADYEDFYILNEIDVEEQLKNAELLLCGIDYYIQSVSV